MEILVALVVGWFLGQAIGMVIVLAFMFFDWVLNLFLTNTTSPKTNLKVSSLNCLSSVYENEVIK